MAVQLGLKYGCHDAGAIAVLLRQLQRGEPQPAPLTELGELACYERPAPPVNDYDQLLGHLPGSREVH
jgi:hypothetical protein